MIDLHTHSNVSDGLLSPAQLVHEAARCGITVLALTDHDTVAGLAAASAAAEQLGIAFIPGIELSSDIGPFEVHILGYEIDRADPDLLHSLAELEHLRLARIEQIVARLSAIGLPVSLDRVRELAGPGTIGRPHVARAMIEQGYVTSIQEAFERYLAAGRPAFVPRGKIVPEQAIALIRKARGVPVLAHPLSTGNIDLTLRRLIPAGLLGIEVYYAEYDDGTQAYLRSIADRYDLIPTGGSDFHGEGFKAGRELGKAPVPAECVERLRAAAARLRAAAEPVEATAVHATLT